MEPANAGSFFHPSKLDVRPDAVCIRPDKKGKRKNMRNYAVIPNQLILDSRLRPSTRRVAVTLYAYRGRDNVLCKSMKVLTKLCHCCRKTLLQALEQLEELRYLKRRHRCRWSQRLKRPIYKANRYYLHVDLSQDYTLMPRSILRIDVTHTQFSVYLLLMARQGQSSHSYPSLRRISATLWIAKSTVCLAVAVLVHGQFIARNHCRTRMGCYSCNCYYLIVIQEVRQSSESLTTAYHASANMASPGGGPIFSTVMSINNIT